MWGVMLEMEDFPVFYYSSPLPKDFLFPDCCLLPNTDGNGALADAHSDDIEMAAVAADRANADADMDGDVPRYTSHELKRIDKRFFINRVCHTLEKLVTTSTYEQMNDHGFERLCTQFKIMLLCDTASLFGIPSRDSSRW